jgi:hypothetical protein
MATLAEALKDKRGFPDAQPVDLGNGLTLTLGELRQYQEASGQDVAKQLETERTRLQSERADVAKAQEEVVNLWTKLQEQSAKAQRAEPTPGTDWQKDPFFQPIAEYLKSSVEATQHKQGEQIAQFQKALGLGVKYITDVISEQRYQMLPEDFRKEMPYEQAIKIATDKKFLDSGGVPDVRKAYDEWRTPRERDAERKKIEEGAYERARTELMSNSLARPSGVPSSMPAADANAPKNLRESFSRLKEDPDFLKLVYGNQQGQA